MSDAGLSQSSSASRDTGSTHQIPFAIPLHPTPKTYRSQSYSVGQLDPENASSTTMGSAAVLGRARHNALQHRPSRPSALSEMAGDGPVLGKVKEVDDDDETAEDTPQASYQRIPESSALSVLARDSVMLPQPQQYNSRIRPRTSAGAAYLSNGYPLSESVPEEAEYAVDELDEANEATADAFGRRLPGRRMSEFGPGPFRPHIGAENRKLEQMNMKKALWSSSPRFFMEDLSQSRRHSFANMPTRQGSVSSGGDSASALEVTSADGQISQAYASAFADGCAFPTTGNGMALFASHSCPYRAKVCSFHADQPNLQWRPCSAEGLAPSRPPFTTRTRRLSGCQVSSQTGLPLRTAASTAWLRSQDTASFCTSSCSSARGPMSFIFKKAQDFQLNLETWLLSKPTAALISEP